MEALVINELLNAGPILEDILLNTLNIFESFLVEHLCHFATEQFIINVIHGIFLLLPDGRVVVDVDCDVLWQWLHLFLFEIVRYLLRALGFL